MNSTRQIQADSLIRDAMGTDDHVLLATPANLDVAVIASLRAWHHYRYHLCVRLDRGKANGRARFEYPRCHDLDATATVVTCYAAGSQEGRS